MVDYSSNSHGQICIWTFHLFYCLLPILSSPQCTAAIELAKLQLKITVGPGRSKLFLLFTMTLQCNLGRQGENFS